MVKSENATSSRPVSGTSSTPPNRQLIDSSYFQLSKHGSYKSMSSMFSASHGSELSHSAEWSTVMIIGTAKIYTEYRYMPVLDCPRL